MSRLTILSLVLAAMTAAAGSAYAWPRAFDEYPPPAGANGFSANGFTLNGFESDVTVIRSAVLADGTVVVLQ